MEIKVNNTKVTVQPKLKLGKYLESANLVDSKGIAVAVNDNVVSKKDWHDCQLNDQDKVLIIRATQGG